MRKQGLTIYGDFVPFCEETDSSESKETNDFKHAEVTAQNCTDLRGKWENQLKSTLNIQSVNQSTGALTGTYISPSGGGSTEYPMVGWVNSRPKPNGTQSHVPVLAFAVRWGEIGSITAWTGYCEEKSVGPTLTTLWHLARPVSEYSWDHVLTNSDEFMSTSDEFMPTSDKLLQHGRYNKKRKLEKERQNPGETESDLIAIQNPILSLKQEPLPSSTLQIDDVIFDPNRDDLTKLLSNILRRKSSSYVCGPTDT
ncbi:4360_t:CDS:2, partial [Ambispora leptoticha]